MNIKTKLLVAAVAAAMSGCGGSDGGEIQAPSPVVGQENHSRDPLDDPNSSEQSGNAEIRVLSNRADLVSAGDVLIELHIPEPGERDGATLFLNSAQITPELVPVADLDGVSRALISGLVVGTNELRLVLPGKGVVTQSIINHPAGGPVFSGPQVEPWTCTNAAAMDDQCNQAPDYQLQYVPASTFDQYMTNFDPQSPGIPDAFVPYDPENPPAEGDIATVTTDQGVTVPYIVRIETGVLNRDRYQIMSLYQPDQPWSGTHPQPQWNGKVLIHHGGNVGVSFAMGNPPNGDISGTAPDGFEGVLGDSISVALSKGFVTLSTAQANLGHNVNLVTAAESLVMSKERIVEQYGPIRYTIGTGCSGGAIAQQHIANAYPGIYQGLIVQCSYPDVWTTATQFADYNLLNNYFGAQMPESPEDLAGFFESLLTSEFLLLQWPALYGHLPINPIVSDLAFFPSAFPDQESCPGLNGKAEVYDKENRPDGLRCGLIDYMSTQFGIRTPDVWSPNEQLLSRGFGGIPLDNVGIQYGLGALQDGVITADQFLAVNRDIGGFDVDIDYQAGRTVADPEALTNAYRTGAINTAENLANIPIIDLRGPDPGIAHDAYHSWQTRARLQKTQGHARNHTIWFGAFPLAGDTIYTTEALYVMDDWLSAIEADTRAAGIAEKVIANKPLEARDRCLSVSSLLSEHGPFVPYTGNLLTPNPTWTQADMQAFPEVPAELGQILDVMTGQVCGLDLGELGLPPIITDLLSPITDAVVAAQQLVVQTRFGTPRTVAGDSIETLTNKCQLKPVDPADYPVNILNGVYDSEAMAREVAKIFPNGVCDYSKPGVGVVPTLTWLQYGDGAEPVVGGAPLPAHADRVSGWAAPAFEVNLAPRRDLD